MSGLERLDTDHRNGMIRWTMGAYEAHSLGDYLYWKGWPDDRVWEDGRDLIEIAHALQRCPEVGRCPVPEGDE